MADHRGSKKVSLSGRIMSMEQIQIAHIERMDTLGLLRKSIASALNGSVL